MIYLEVPIGTTLFICQQIGKLTELFRKLKSVQITFSFLCEISSAFFAKEKAQTNKKPLIVLDDEQVNTN